MPRPEPLRPCDLRCPPRLDPVRAAAVLLFSVAGLTVGAPGRADAPRADPPSSGAPGAPKPGAPKSGASGSGDAGRPAGADGTAGADAATLIRVGDRFRARGQWQLAKEAYRSAYLVGKESRIRCEWGMAELALSQHRDAALQLDACLKDPRAGTAEQRGRYMEALERARREVGQLDIEVSQPGAELFVDGKSFGKNQTTVFYMYVTPGTHTVQASLPGFLDATQTAQVERGGAARVVLRLDPRPVAPPPPARSARGTATPALSTTALGKAAPTGAPQGVFDGGPGAARICGIGVTTLGLAGGVVATMLASSYGAEGERRAGALRRRSSATICASPPAEHAAECAAIDDLFDAHDIGRNVASGFFIGAGVVAAATLASFVHFGLEHRARPVRVSPVAGAEVGGVMLQGVW